jgi:hypothetical protein
LVAALAAFALYQTQHTTAVRLRESQIAQCQFTNKILAELNQRAPLEQTVVEVVRDFLDSAKSAREAAYARDHFKADQKAALKYAAGLRKLVGVRFTVIPPLDCERITPKV